MKHLAVLFLCLFSIPSAKASDFHGVYAVIDKVVFSPDADHPLRAQVFGVFSLSGSTRDDYGPPQRGYLYFELTTGNSGQILKEWADIKSVAGKRIVVSFGQRGPGLIPSVRPADAAPASPDVYRFTGVTQYRADTDYGPIQALLNFH